MKKENDVRNRIIKEIFQKNEKNSKNVEKRSRFIFNKEKVKIIEKIKKVKKMQQIVFLFVRKRIFNQFRIINI
jgi:hypothetical protein